MAILNDIEGGSLKYSDLQAQGSLSVDGCHVSLVIGCLAEEIDRCRLLILGLKENLKYIREIVCVVSSLPSQINAKDLGLGNLVNASVEIYSYEDTIFPGAARNIGIRKTKYPYIAFLDVNTEPEPDWLEIAINKLINSDTQGTLGRTKYVGKSLFEKCFIASTYGDNPIFTVPGTLISRNLINQIGFFIPSARCGEDAEWIRRAIYFHKSIRCSDVSTLKYRNIIGRGFKELSSKWFRNYYLACFEDLLVYQRQRYLYIIFFATISLLVAFGWNTSGRALAGWNVDSFLYIPHISKITAIFLATFYFVFRAFLLPIAKGVPILRVGLKTMLMIVIISFSLDLVKTAAFAKSTLDRYLITRFKIFKR